MTEARLTLKEMIKELPKEIDDYLEDLRIRILKHNMDILNEIWPELSELPRNIKNKSQLKAYANRLNELDSLKRKLNNLLHDAETPIRREMQPVYQEKAIYPAEIRIKKEFGEEWKHHTRFNGIVCFYDLNESELKVYKSIDKIADKKVKEAKEAVEQEFGYTLKQLIAEEKWIKQESTSARKDIAVWNAFLKKHKNAETLPLMELSHADSLNEAKKIVERHSRISKEDMKMDLITRTYNVCGKINKMTITGVGAKGTLSGIAYGEKRNAHVETIPAGGYNIQCFHYRVLVKPL